MTRQNSQSQKDYSEILIIGGGIIGLSCAYYLAKSKYKVTIFEQDTCGSKATGASLGVLWPPSPIGHNEFKTIHLYSLSNFEEFVSEVESVSGVSISYKRCGGLEVISSQSQYESALKKSSFIEEKTTINTTNENHLSLINSDEIAEIEPSIIGTEYGALWCRSCAMVQVNDLVNGLVNACKRLNVDIIENKKVEQIETFRGEIKGVTCDNQLLHKADKVLITAGCSTTRLHNDLINNAYVEPVKGQALLFEVEKLPIQRVINWQRIYVRPWGKSHIAVGSTTEFGLGDDISVTEDALNELMSKAIEIIPGLQKAKLIDHWSGLRPASADRRPYIGMIPEINGLFVASGHYKVGIALAPVTGQIIRDILTDTIPKFEVASLQPRPPINFRRKKSWDPLKVMTQ